MGMKLPQNKLNKQKHLFLNQPTFPYLPAMIQALFQSTSEAILSGWKGFMAEDLNELGL